jgi:hypothetical protein
MSASVNRYDHSGVSSCLHAFDGNRPDVICCDNSASESGVLFAGAEVVTLRVIKDVPHPGVDKAGRMTLQRSGASDTATARASASVAANATWTCAASGTASERGGRLPIA